MLVLGQHERSAPPLGLPPVRQGVADDGSYVSRCRIGAVSRACPHGAGQATDSKSAWSAWLVFPAPRTRRRMHQWQSPLPCTRRTSARHRRAARRFAAAAVESARESPRGRSFPIRGCQPGEWNAAARTQAAAEPDQFGQPAMDGIYGGFEPDPALPVRPAALPAPVLLWSASMTSGRPAQRSASWLRS